MEVMQVKHLLAHISSGCQHTTVPPPSVITVGLLLYQGSQQSLMVTQTMGVVAEATVVDTLPANHLQERSD